MSREPKVEKKEKWSSQRFMGLSIGAYVTATVQGLLYFLITFGTPEQMFQYGVVGFVFLPFLCGWAGGYLVEFLGPCHKVDVYGAGLYGTAFGLVSLILIGYEGMICVLMAGPIIFGSTALGSLVYVSMGSPWVSAMVCGAMGAGSFGSDAKSRQNPHPGSITHVTVGVVEGSPEEVWPLVVEQGELSPPTFWMFKAGVVHPVRTVCDSDKAGARRVCELSTGTVLETVTESRPGRVFEFAAHSTPPSMVEFNPFHSEIAAHHLKDYIVMHRGRFELRALPDSRTEIRCTSWYTNRFAPLGYWRLWSDMIVGQVHLQVMTDINKKLVEG